MREDSIIKKYIAPLSVAAGPSQAFADDVAWFENGISGPLVISSDALVESIHFLQNSKASDLAKKLWGVNISDLAAKGAVPVGFILNLALPKKIALDDKWLEDFFSTIAINLKTWGGELWGGDTVSSPDSIMLALTAFGRPKVGKIPTRSGAKPGEILFTSGTLGDSALGLHLLQNSDARKNLSSADIEFLSNRYLHPTPRLSFGVLAAEFVSAMMDISDGLCCDLARLCSASEVSAEINSWRLPISAAAEKFPQKYLAAALNGGDDYELLFSVAEEDVPLIQRIAEETNTKITAIGKIFAGAAGEITVKNLAGEIINIPTGFSHF